MDAPTIAILIASLAFAMAVMTFIVAVVRGKKEDGRHRTEQVRSLAGLFAVMASDGAIAAAAALGIAHTPDNGQHVALLTSAFTGITAITTAYFGIKAVSNTADSAIHKKRQDGDGDGDGD
ncbi:hypothetical protein GCM10009601_41640 [Streptomyces thermospinosisporus]|uniref:Uncharacterized protein n=1 Tax=Streptomyces thermospinosisporus TaxID=161482 RepID=A0ABN1Z2B1_9ACTN